MDNVSDEEENNEDIENEENGEDNEEEQEEGEEEEEEKEEETDGSIHLDVSIEGVKASKENEEDEEFFSIPGVEEIDDNSAEPLEEVRNTFKNL